MKTKKNAQPRTINLFFIIKGSYKCMITTSDEVSVPYDRKITVELEDAKQWKGGTASGRNGSATIPEEALSRMTNDKYFFIDCRKWMLNNVPEQYLALEKSYADGREYYSRDLMQTINSSAYNVFLFPA